MRRGVVAFSALALIGLGVTGCGLFRYEQREPWRLQAEEACLSQKLVTASAYMSRSSEVDGPGACGMSYPFKVTAFADGTVGLTTRATLACPMIPNIDAWLNEIVQPAASLYFGSSVIEVKSGSYACRGRNNQRGARLSEHAFGNALDVMAFRLADGREVSVVKGWRGAEEEQEFLRETFVGACSYFSTVLGPGADAFHYDHFHLDLARHDPRGERRVCKPMLKFTPRIDPAVAAKSGQQPAPWADAPSQPSTEMEEEEDPFVIDSSASRASPRSAVAHADRPGSSWAGTALSSPGYLPQRPLAGQRYLPQASRPGLVPPQAIPSDREGPFVAEPPMFNGHTIY
jgi:hypothetical protein